jgi:hypothetical protein
MVGTGRAVVKGKVRGHVPEPLTAWVASGNAARPAVI